MAATAQSSADDVFAHMDKTLPRSVWWDADADCLKMVDQIELPAQFNILDVHTVEQVFTYIKNMTVRGAPAIGVSAAFGVYLAARASKATTSQELFDELQKTKQYLDSSRPTAVNLMWATARMIDYTQLLVQAGNLTVAQMSDKLLTEAKALAEEDIALNKRIGLLGSTVVPQGANILHHCNTGTVATVQYGTAIGIIYTCHAQGKNVHVWIDETRPRLQGAKLTAWELMKANVPCHLIPDSASGLLMYQNKVDVVLFGADRVASNGDVANKIGTFKLAVCAREHGIPVYAVVPTSTIDLTISSGREIPIEERSATEVTHIGDVSVAPANVPVFNPGFDVTPFKYLTGIITEEGICYPPFAQSLKAAKESAEARIKQNWADKAASVLSK